MSNARISGRFYYWSDRAVQSLAEDNGVELGGHLRRQATVGATVAHFPISAQVQGAFSSGEQKTRNRLEEAKRITEAMGSKATEALARPPKAQWVWTVGRVTLSKMIHYAKNDGLLFHLQTTNRAGQRIDLCLFGSLDNLHGSGPIDSFTGGWYSSAYHAVQELLETQGQVNTSQWDDPESLSVEVLRIALEDGWLPNSQPARPETRGRTILRAEACELMAEVYSDVVLTEARWSLTGDLKGAQRIIVGRPLWVRTTTDDAVVRYAELRNGPRWARWWWLFQAQRYLRRQLNRLPLVHRRQPSLPMPAVEELDPRPDRTTAPSSGDA
ncbi:MULTISPECIES: hypothetical protein [Streptacidiphilus]|uniref:Uncharacterized protein n=1 Tax=Streptacidiphilus cavernicola TaxID=3342716 RepID=A0ABV6UP10_9ACTN|nr:hypothetical protein [Streptacidiphilus jeojiense]